MVYQAYDPTSLRLMSLRGTFLMPSRYTAVPPTKPQHHPARQPAILRLLIPSSPSAILRLLVPSSPAAPKMFISLISSVELIESIESIE